MDNSNSTSNQQMTSSMMSKIPGKRDRDENDVFEVPKSSLKKAFTAGEFGMEDEYNYSGSLSSDLWNAADIPEINSSSVGALGKLTEKLTKNTSTKKLKNYRPEKNTSGFNILVGLLKFENETKKKYASRKEIKETLKKDPDFSTLQITSWAPMATLIKYELISNLQLNGEEKYSLTENGYRVADECFIERTKNSEASDNASTIGSSKENSNSRDNNVMITEAQDTMSTMSTTVSNFNTSSFGGESFRGFFDIQGFDDSLKASSNEVPSFEERLKSKAAEKPSSKKPFFMVSEVKKDNSMRFEEASDGTITFAQYEKMSVEKEKTRPEREPESRTESRNESRNESRTESKPENKPESKESNQVCAHQVKKSK